MACAYSCEEGHEVILHEERAVVEKETVPVERVRLDKDTRIENVTVSEVVRKETSKPTESTTPAAFPGPSGPWTAEQGYAARSIDAALQLPVLRHQPKGASASYAAGPAKTR